MFILLSSQNLHSASLKQNTLDVSCICFDGFDGDFFEIHRLLHQGSGFSGCKYVETLKVGPALNVFELDAVCLFLIFVILILLGVSRNRFLPAANMRPAFNVSTVFKLDAVCLFSFFKFYRVHLGTGFFRLQI